MSLCLSGRAFEEATGISIDQWAQEVSNSTSVSGNSSAALPRISIEAATSIGTSVIDKHQPDDESLTRYILSRVNLTPIEEVDEGTIGTYVHTDVRGWSHGCVPVLNVAYSERYEVTMYMGCGDAVLRHSHPRWLEKLWHRASPSTTPIRLQALGSADNYSGWSRDIRKQRIEAEGWFPSSPEGLTRILATDYDFPTEAIEAEDEIEGEEVDLPFTPCDKFDHILETRMNNLNTPERRQPWVDSIHALNPRVRILGRVCGFAPAEDDSDETRVLVRPVLIREA
ncbi:hypothetical protein [Actinomyces radicidentis]|nr:hypothetical protein [Actinomyces radicidentis]